MTHFPLGHTMPQPPQLRGSEAVSTQMPPQHSDPGPDPVQLSLVLLHLAPIDLKEALTRCAVMVITRGGATAAAASFFSTSRRETRAASDGRCIGCWSRFLLSSCSRASST